MKTGIRLLLVGIALAVLTSGWVYLYVHSRAISADRQNATLGLLKDLKQMDSDWNTNVLKSQAEINLSYDPLTQPLRNFSDIVATLDAEMSLRDDAELKKSVSDIHSVLEEKAALIDRFKAQNAVLKNSLRYAPTAHKDIQNQMRSERDTGLSKGSQLMRNFPDAFNELEKSLATSGSSDSDKSNRNVDAAINKLRSKMNSAKLASKLADTAAKSAFTLVSLESDVSALVGEALRYNSVPDTETEKQLATDLDNMRNASPSYPPSVRDAVDNLVKHLALILRLRNTQSELLGEISQLPVVPKIDGFANALIGRFDVELKEQFLYQRLLLGYSAGALLLVFGFAGLATYRNATERQRLAEIVAKQTKEIKENEVQLVHAQKMNALGEMVASITHEVNTPLASVKSAFQSSRELIGSVFQYIDESGKLAFMLLTPSPKDEAARATHKAALGKQLMRVNELGKELRSFDTHSILDQLLGDGVKNVEYIHQVVVNMLNFSRLDRSKISAVKVEAGIESTLSMAKHFLRKLKVTKEFGDTQLVNCDIGQINQVLLNLIRNAAQALPESGGEITIKTSMLSAKEISIAIRDNGTGIPAEILSKIWEPFFTTKKEGAGTGLGLSTCKKIVTSHGGHIDVDSVVGQGTTFTIILPVLPPESLYEESGQEMNTQLLATA